MSLPTTLSSFEDAITLAEVALGRDRFVAIVDGRSKFVMPISGEVPFDGSPARCRNGEHRLQCVRAERPNEAR